MTADPAHRHGGPDAGWYVPDGHGWQRISDAEVWDHDDAAHFGSDPNGRHAVVVEDGPWAGIPPTPAELAAAREVTISEIPAGTILCDEDGNEIGRTLPGEQLIKISHGQKPPAP